MSKKGRRRRGRVKRTDEVWVEEEVNPGGRREKLKLTNNKIRMFEGKKKQEKDRQRSGS